MKRRPHKAAQNRMMPENEPIWAPTPGRGHRRENVERVAGDRIGPPVTTSEDLRPL